MKKGCGIAAVVVAVLGLGIGGLVWTVFFLTSGAVESADQFLNALGRGDSHAAYLQSSGSFRTAQNETEFEKVVIGLGLHEFQTASWNSRTIENNLATLDGTVQLRSGGRNRLTMRLIKEDKKWKVLSLEGPIVGASINSASSEARPSAKQNAESSPLNNSPSIAVPTANDITQTVIQQLSGLDQAVRSGDFESFHRALSNTWKSQVTTQELATAFKPLEGEHGDWSKIDPATLILDEPPAVNEQGILVVKGHAPINSRRLVFDLKFIRESTGWEPFGVQVREVDVPPQLPDEHALQMLVKTTILKFNAALQGRDFAIFHDDAANIFKSLYEPNQLLVEFKSFVDQPIDLSPIQDLNPTFDKTPVVDRYGTLLLNGHFKTQPSQLSFDLGYLYERNTWKLTMISVNLK